MTDWVEWFHSFLSLASDRSLFSSIAVLFSWSSSLITVLLSLAVADMFDNVVLSCRSSGFSDTKIKCLLTSSALASNYRDYKRPLIGATFSNGIFSLVCNGSSSIYVSGCHSCVAHFLCNGITFTCDGRRVVVRCTTIWFQNDETSSAAAGQSSPTTHFWII